ncbi:hypothetical protein FKM82_012036 [Ascaphus truei]
MICLLVVSRKLYCAACFKVEKYSAIVFVLCIPQAEIPTSAGTERIFIQQFRTGFQQHTETEPSIRTSFRSFLERVLLFLRTQVI